MIRSEILNIYVFKSFESFLKKYFINENKMKMINVDEKIIKIDVCHAIVKDLRNKK